MKQLNILLVALLGLTAVSAQASVANAEKLIMIYTTPVSYTHLTLPTIYSV